MNDTALVTKKSESLAADQVITGVVESVMIQGDLSKLQSKQRVEYYAAVCKSLQLNPLTRPFDYISLKGKLTLYAKKDCAEQLRRNYNVSVKIVGKDWRDGVYVVTAQASLPNGRVDEAIGAVFVGNSKGEDFANGLMKAETKAKRRVTLSICGLGILDEAEVADMKDVHYIDSTIAESDNFQLTPEQHPSPEVQTQSAPQPASQPQPPVEDPQPVEEPLTRDQINLLMSEALGKGWQQFQVLEVLQRTYGNADATKLTQKRYGVILNLVKTKSFDEAKSLLDKRDQEREGANAAAT